MATSAPNPQKSAGEPLFSYAQAAKGRSPSVPNTALTVEKPTAKRTASEGHNASVEDFPDPNGRIKSGKDGVTTAVDSTAPSTREESSGTQSQRDMTWEKESQSSRNAAKDGDQLSQSSHNATDDKPESGKQDTDTISWADETPAPSELRDAPPPAVNIWERRKEEQAKAKAAKPAVLPVPKATESHHSLEPANGSRVAGGSCEVKKTDPPKKTKGNANPHSIDGNNILNATRDPSRAADSKSKIGDEGQSKHAARGGRIAEPHRSIASIAAPPPPAGDAISWPTPDTAQDEEKRRSQERAEKADKEKNTVPKPNTKKEWTAMPFVPSAVFSTPIPQSRRGGGGRPNRGGKEATTGRGGGMLQTANGSEKPTMGPGAAAQPPAGSFERSKAEPSMPKNAASGPKPKRSASAGPPVMREQRKGVEASTEKQHEVDTKGNRSNATNSATVPTSNGISASTQTEHEGIVNLDTASTTGDAIPWDRRIPREDLERGERRPGGNLDSHAHPRSNAVEKRSDPPGRSFDYSRDLYNSLPIRERSEGQRGRGGGYRNRNNGNHALINPPFSNGQGIVNGQPTHHQSSLIASNKTHSTHERRLSQSQNNSYVQSQPNPRSYRSGSRSQSIPHPGSPYSRYSNGTFTGPPNLSNIQTDVANVYGYQPGHQGIMSAMPFTSFAEQAAFSVFSMVSMQMEYYFSVDNLCKDLFLRKHMDSQGYVFLSVLVKFNRMQSLTQDIELIRWVCLHSTNIELRTAADGIDRLRKRTGWEQWVLAKEERDVSAQNDGPAQVEAPRIPQPPMVGMPYGYDGVSEVATPYSPPNRVVDDIPTHPTSNGTATPYTPAAIGAMTNGCISETPVNQTPMSAAVPDFAPSLPQTNGHSLTPLDPPQQVESLFTDERVENLFVVRKTINSTAPLLPPFASPSSRTFSNGSIDGRTINDELSRIEQRQPRPKINGNMANGLDELDILPRSRSPFNPAKRPINNHVSPVLWVKDMQTPIDELPNDLTHEPYHAFRANAISQREESAQGTCHPDMDNLYQFWSHFLIRNFNVRMYQEFRQMAFDDVNKHNSDVGLKNLVQYYEGSMLGKNLIPDEVANDLVDLVKSESSNTERPAFDKLRAAWRNGATNLKNRKKIDNIIDSELKAQLDQ